MALSRDRLAVAVGVGVGAAAAAYLYYRWRSESQEDCSSHVISHEGGSSSAPTAHWEHADGRTSLFEVSTKNGFLPIARPLHALPQAYHALEEVMSRLPDLLHEESADAISAAVAALPELDVPADASPALLQALMRDYSILVSSLLLKRKGATARVPANIARPFARVCAAVDEPMIMSYDSYCLSNCYDVRASESAAPAYEGWEWENLRLIRAFDGGPEEATFILIHSEIESHTPRLIKAYDAIITALHARDASALLVALHQLRVVMECIIVSQLKMFNASDPRNYAEFVRPWIFGWKNNPDLPDGVVFEGVDGDAPTFLRGETGAQSTIVPSLDVVLGITHKVDALKQMLTELEAYRPAPHRHFLAELRRILYAPPASTAVGPTATDGAADKALPTASASSAPASEPMHLLRTFIAQSHDPALAKAFNACVAYCWAFRDIHVTFSEAYIARFTRREAATGGTPYKAYLRKHRDESTAQQLPCPCGNGTECGHVVAHTWPIPDTATFNAEIDAILAEETRNGIPAHLLARHADIITREGRGALSLAEKRFPKHGQMSRR